MRPTIRVFSLLACLLVLSACDEPFIFAAGGKLKGSVTEVPDRWQLDSDSAVAQLETLPEDPYSINFTYVQLNDRFYVYAGATRTNWVKHIEQNPLVRVRVQETIYPALAVRVMSANERSEFAAVWAGRDPMGFEEVWLYRLQKR